MVVPVAKPVSAPADGSALPDRRCPLFGEKRTSVIRVGWSAFDPTRASVLEASPYVAGNGPRNVILSI